MPQNKSWEINYEKLGLEPPEHIPFLTDEELEKEFAKIRKNTVHGDWKQQGNMITCYKCLTPHGDTIPTNFILEGTDKNGMPMLRKIQMS